MATTLQGSPISSKFGNQTHRPKFILHRFQSGMGMRRSASKSKNRVYGGPWSDLNHDLLTLVMMKLEAIDFRSFSGVCKSWRSLALPNKSMFMASRPPMALSRRPNEKKEYSLQDLGGNIFKIRFPKIGERDCAGVTCGYLVFFTIIKTRDFLLLNPITRHGIRFPKVPKNLAPYKEGVRAILVFSPSRSAWVFVLLCRFEGEIWFSTAGTGEWDNIDLDSGSGFIDVHEFKGKIYVMDNESCLYELIIDPEPVLMLLNNTNFDFLFRQFVSSGENLYAMESFSWLYEYKFQKLDFGEMKWVSPEENSTEECAFFVTDLKHSAAVKPGLWSESDYWSRFKNSRYKVRDTCGKNMFYKADIWYFPHDCLKVNLKHE